MTLPIVTTGQHPDGESVRLAEQVAGELGTDFVPRRKRSVRKLMTEFGRPVVVAGKERYEYHTDPDVKPLFFHPGLAAIRIKRLQRGGNDAMVEVCDLGPGDTFLDCTMGLASDSTVASFVTDPSGQVTACEVDPMVSYIVGHGLATYSDSPEEVLDAMRRIDVRNKRADDFLESCDAASYDIVYLDPMFEETIEESAAFAPLRSAGLHDLPDDRLFREAVRVARRRVVLKAHFRSELFSRYGFTRIDRANTKFHYGYIEIE